MLKSGLGAWKAAARRPAQDTLPFSYPYVPKPKPAEKSARRPTGKEKPAGTSGMPPRGEVAQYLSVSGEEGLDFKSEVGAGKKTKSTIPVIIQKTADDIGLTLVGVDMTGAGSGG